MLARLVCPLPLLLLAAFQAIGSPEVTFHASGPGGLRIQGTTHELSVKETPKGWTFAVPLEHVTTGISLRDQHMREKYLEVAKYPQAELVLPRNGVQLPQEGATSDASADGTFSVHGKSHPVKVHYKVSRRGKAYTVQANFPVNLHDYDIGTPSYLGASVKPDVQVNVSCSLENS
jgi:polyisoprenoid-binding protein YceI